MSLHWVSSYSGTRNQGDFSFFKEAASLFANDFNPTSPKEEILAHVRVFVPNSIDHSKELRKRWSEWPKPDSRFPREYLTYQPQSMEIRGKSCIWYRPGTAQSA